MFYSPDGKYRRTNFILAYKYMYKARRNNFKSLEKENPNKIPEKKNIVEQIKSSSRVGLEKDDSGQTSVGISRKFKEFWICAKP